MKKDSPKTPIIVRCLVCEKESMLAPSSAFMSISNACVAKLHGYKPKGDGTLIETLEDVFLCKKHYKQIFTN